MAVWTVVWCGVGVWLAVGCGTPDGAAGTPTGSAVSEAEGGAVGVAIGLDV